jgi:hypothetical protein
MNKFIEKSLIIFLKQNKKIILIVILIPLLISYTYYTIYKPCHTIHKIQTRGNSADLFEQIFFQLKDNKIIEFSNLSMPFIEFKGKALECTENFQNARETINDLNLFILDDLTKTTKEIQNLLNNNKNLLNNNKLENSFALKSIYELEKLQIYKNIGADMSTVELYEKLGMRYTIISISDVNNSNKIFFSITFGSLIFSLLTILTIFFYKHLFRKF